MYCRLIVAEPYASDDIYATADFIIDRTKWNIGRQSKYDSWDLLSAIKDKAIDDNVSISLRLAFNQ